MRLLDQTRSLELLNFIMNAQIILKARKHGGFVMKSNHFSALQRADVPMKSPIFLNQRV